jgi:hypothetical protein
MRTKRWNLKGKGTTLIFIAVAAAFLLWFFVSLGQLSSDQGEEGKQQLELALRRASVACYAAEGVYPPDLDYLTEHYGVQIDENRYNVFYSIFAENMMPDITVVEKEI